MTQFDDNKRFFAEMVSGIPYTQVKEAWTGQLDTSGRPIYADPTRGLAPGYIWVTQYFGRAATPAIIDGVDAGAAGVRIEIGLNKNNELVAIHPVIDKENVGIYQRDLAGLGVPQKNPALQNNPIPNRLLQDGLVTKSLSGGLNIAIQSFNSTQLIFPTIDPFDVSASVPSGAGEVRWTVVSIDPAFDPTDPAASIVLSNGAVSTMTLSMFQLNEQGAAEITYPLGNYRLAALMLFNGMTAVDDSTAIVDLREHFGAEESTSGLTVSDGSTTLTDITELDFSGATVSSGGAGIADIAVTGGGGSASLLLDYTQAADIFNGASITANTWTDVDTNQTFTVTNASAVIEVDVALGLVLVIAANQGAALRIVIDSAGTPIPALIDFALNSSGVYSLSGGAVKLASLTAGAHTVKVQLQTQAGALAYLLPTTAAGFEYFRIQVTQLA